MIRSGTVVRVGPSAVIVASREGSLTIDRKVDATLYAVGDRVRIVNGVVVGRQTNISKIVRV